MSHARALTVAAVILSTASPLLAIDYFGRTAPPKTPEIFAPGIVSTAQQELTSSFTPDGTEFWFAMADPRRTHYTIMVTRRVDGRWTEPEVAPFSGRWSDADPFVTPDGKRLWFVSMRPTGGTGKPTNHFDLWYVDRTPTGWGEPVNAGAPINTERQEMYVSVSRKGTVCFHSDRPGTNGGFDVYCARQQDGRWLEPENMGPGINSPGMEYDPFIAPDESYILFTASGRPGELGRGDLYASYRGADGAYGPAKHLPALSSPGLDFCPNLSPDGKALFFSRDITPLTDYARPRTRAEWLALLGSIENGLGNVWWVDASILDASRD